MTTYFYPSNYGAAEFPAAGGANGVQTFTGNVAQGSAGSYIVVTPIDTTGVQGARYSVTFNYVGPGTGITETLTQTAYSNQNFIETTDGSADYLLTNGPIAANASYTFLGASSPYVPSSAIATSNPTCFCTGTLIATREGVLAVEDLVIGDFVVTAAGAHREIRWIGHRAYASRFANSNPDLLPICIKTGAIADGVPARDLWVSPKHALYIDGVLIPAAALVNGASIIKADCVDSLEYWHVELDSHDVLLAENMPAESFVDDNGRNFFCNAPAFYALYPDAVEKEAVYCAPRVESGHVVAAVWRRLAERVGLITAKAARFGDLRGHVDASDGRFVAGWAQDPFYPDAPVCLDVLVDGELIAMTYANLHRPDLQAVGVGNGCHGFRLDLSLTPETAHTVVVRRSADGAALAGSPWLIAPAASARAA